jgi:hypothetical protein
MFVHLLYRWKHAAEKVMEIPSPGSARHSFTRQLRGGSLYDETPLIGTVTANISSLCCPSVHHFLFEYLPTSEVGTPMRHSYVLPIRWMVIYGYEVPGGALNLSSTELPRPWSPWESSPSRKNPHGRTGNRTRDLIISSQKL